MSRANYLLTIRSNDPREPNIRYITVYAAGEDDARDMGSKAAELMLEDYYKGNSYYVEQVNCIE